MSHLAFSFVIVVQAFLTSSLTYLYKNKQYWIATRKIAKNKEITTFVGNPKYAFVISFIKRMNKINIFFICCFSGVKEEEDSDLENWTMESREREALKKCKKAILLDLVTKLTRFTLKLWKILLFKILQANINIYCFRMWTTSWISCWTTTSWMSTQRNQF